MVVDGLQGRGVIIARKGRRLTVQFRNGLTVSRDQMFVHSLSSNMYKSNYGSMAAGGPGSGRKPNPLSQASEKDPKLSAILKKPWKKQTEEERLYVANHDPRQRSLFNVGLRPKMPKKPNPSFKHGLGKHGSFKTSPSLSPPVHWQKLEADAGGEPDVGNYSHAHMEPGVFINQPPSLRNKRPVPTDDPMEKDDKYLDVTKRKAKDTQRQRDELLKHDAPAGNPPLIPARTTLIAPHMGINQPLLASRVKVIQRPARMFGSKVSGSYLHRKKIRAV